VDAAKYLLQCPVLRQLDARLAVAFQPADDSLVRLRLVVAGPSVVLEVRQSAEVLREAVAQPELSLKMWALWKPPDAEAHLV
jgi:hypothetical protein